jgi:hypothetical protein
MSDLLAILDSFTPLILVILSVGIVLGFLDHFVLWLSDPETWRGGED